MIELSAVTDDQVGQLADLKRESFVVKFGSLYALEDLSAFLTASYSPSVVAAEVADPGCLHRVAWEGERMVGYAKVAYESPYARFSGAVRPLALMQLYTAPDATGRGIGGRLMTWVLTHARDIGADAVQLSVFIDNPGARRFYARHGFRQIGDIDFYVGSHRDHDLVVERVL